MKEQIDEIRRGGRDTLASLLEQIGPMPLKEYSASLWDHSPEVQMEPELQEALEEEFEANMWPESVIKRAIGDQQGQASTLNNLGTVWYALGNYVAARERLERSLSLKRAVGDQQGEASTLNNLGVICYEEAKYTAAQAYYEQALGITRAIGDKRETGFALTCLGMVLERLGDLDEAGTTYCEALFIRREIGQAALAIEDIAGLGRVALARGRWQEAQQYAEECLGHITAHGVAGIEYVFEVYLTCVRVLEACGEHERARGVLAEAYALLMERADKIEDETLRGSFLKNVPVHREVVQKWESDAPR